MSNDRQVMAAWQAFVAGGAPVCEVRPIVAHSWQRCIDRVAVEKDRAPVSPNEAFERARRRFPLGHNALAPVLNEAHRFLSETGSIMLLADADALVLYAQGDTDTMGYAGEINLQPGGRWDEALIGTNAIGTALHTAAPVQIHSAEHFCWEIKKWTCAAAPVQHPLDGHTLGILDVSGPAETFHPQALAFAVAAARRIESELAQRLNDEHATLLRRYLGKRHQLSGDVALSTALSTDAALSADTAPSTDSMSNESLSSASVSPSPSSATASSSGSGSASPMRTAARSR